MSEETRSAAERPIVTKESRVTARELVEVSYTYDELLAIFDCDDNVVRPLVLRCRELEAALSAAEARGEAAGRAQGLREAQAWLIDWEIIQKDLVVKRQKPGHGSCCTCQVCGFAYDDCECQRNHQTDSWLKIAAPAGVATTEALAATLPPAAQD